MQELLTKQFNMEFRAEYDAFMNVNSLMKQIPGAMLKKHAR
jgi:hypothetical protein